MTASVGTAPPTPITSSAPTAAGLLGAAGTAATAAAGAANGAGGDFLALVLQMLGATAAPAPGGGELSTDSASGSVADAPLAAGAKVGGEQSTVPGGKKVEDAPPAGDQGAGAAAVDPALAALLATVAPGSLQLVAGTATAAKATGVPGIAAVAGAKDGKGAQPVGSTPASGADRPAARTEPAASAATTDIAAPTTPSTAPLSAATAPAQVSGAAPTGTPAPVAHQVFDRVVEAIRVSDAGPGPTRVTVRLQPESLGEVRVVMSVRDGALQVSLAGGDQAHHSLLQGAPELSRLLQAAGAPDVQVVVRDLAQGTTGPVLQTTAQAAQAAAQVAQVHHGQGLSADLAGSAGQGSGQGNGQASAQAGAQGGAGQSGAAPGDGQGRRTPARATGPIDVPDATTPSRRTESVTRTRTAGVDVTM